MMVRVIYLPTRVIEMMYVNGKRVIPGSFMEFEEDDLDTQTGEFIDICKGLADSETED